MAELQEVKAELQEIKNVMPELDAGALDRLTACALAAIARDEAVGPATLMFLLGRYAATEQEEIADTLGLALAAALGPQPVAPPTRDLAEWTKVFAAATTISDDIRVRQAVALGVERLRQCWHMPGGDETATQARAIAACLVAVPACDVQDLLGAAIDQLERLIANRYEPGLGMGDLDAQISCASALLSAFALTGRVPYSMLADELMQLAHRTSWDAGDGGFRNAGDAADSKPFVANCEAALLCCHLAALHRDADYQETAVTASNVDYLLLATRTLAFQSARVHALGAAAAPYGLALAEWLKLQ